jgi:hypothetical protein
MFAQEKLQKIKTYYPNILVQVTVKKLTLFSIISFEYFSSFIIFLTYFLNYNIFLLYFTYTLDVWRNFFQKKFKKYPEGFLKSFSVFFKEKLQKNKTYYLNILV